LCGTEIVIYNWM